MIAQILSESIPTTVVALSHLFQIIPMLPHPLTRLLSGLSLLSAVVVPAMFEEIQLV